MNDVYVWAWRRRNSLKRPNIIASMRVLCMCVFLCVCVCVETLRVDGMENSIWVGGGQAVTENTVHLHLTIPPLQIRYTALTIPLPPSRSPRPIAHVRVSNLFFRGTPAVKHERVYVRACRYIPGLGEVLKWAWVQYLAVFLILYWLLEKVVFPFLFKYQILRTNPLSDIMPANRQHQF